MYSHFLAKLVVYSLDVTATQKQLLSDFPDPDRKSHPSLELLFCEKVGQQRSKKHTLKCCLKGVKADPTKNPEAMYYFPHDQQQQLHQGLFCRADKIAYKRADPTPEP